MNIEKFITGLLILFILVSCAPAVDAPTVPPATSTPAIPPTPTLSPLQQEDNGVIVVNTDGKIQFHDFNGTKLHQVTSQMGWITRSIISPDLRTIAYTVAPITHGLSVRELYGSEETQLVGPETRVFFFSWSEDGDSLLYATRYGVYIYSLDSPPKKLFSLAGTIKDADTSYFFIHPSPDGQNFVIQQALFEESVFNMFFLSIPMEMLVKLNDTPYKTGSIHNGFGGWGKDGQYFYYSADTSAPESNMQLDTTFVFDASSLSLVDGFPNPYPLAWSPDGDFVTQSLRQNRRSILINNGDFSAGWNEAYSISSTGGNEFNNMAWSADSQKLAVSLIDYFSPTTRQILLYDPRQNQMQTLVDELDMTPNHLEWSPDGNYLLITDSVNGVSYSGGAGICQFRIYSFSRNELLNIPPVDCHGILASGWSVDGRSYAFLTYVIYTEESKEAGLYLLDMESGSVQTLDITNAFRMEVIH